VFSIEVIYLYNQPVIIKMASIFISSEVSSTPKVDRSTSTFGGKLGSNSSNSFQIVPITKSFSSTSS